MKTGYFIRNTLVNYSHLEALPQDRQDKIKELTVTFNSIGYMDATTEIGPDQWRRTSDKQRAKIGNTTLQAFAIEDEIRHLLKTDEQLSAEAIKEAAKAKQDTINRITWRLRDIEMYLQRKLTSNRENPTKKEYRELKEQLTALQTV